VTLGAITGSSVTHDSQYIVTAQFAIPALEPVGWKDAAVVFTLPEGGTLTYSKTAAFQVTAGSGVAASFTGTPTSGTVPLTVNFTNTSTGTITNRLWSFGDGATSTAANPAHTYTNTGSYTVSLAVFAAAGSNTLSRAGYITVTATPTPGGYVVVDTGQTLCYNDTTNIAPPAAGQPFYGQDAQFSGTQPSYTKSGDGLTVKDNVTGLTWQQSYYTGQVYWAEAQAVATAMNATNYGGYSDWRLPTIKELYSLWNGSIGWPFIDTSYFTLNYGSQDELSHAIFWSSSKYSGLLESTVDGNVGAELAFGVNFGTGHIKAYAIASGPRHLVRCVRGASYGINNFLDQGDGTITDQATGLMWARTDSGSGMDWERALAYAQTQNAANYLGHSDWRLPSSKELQSMVDYTRSPGATDPANVGPAIDPMFTCTGITNEAGAADYPWYWTSTTNPGLPGTTTNDTAWYVAFGRAVGSDGKDLHGAGAVRFDTKIAGTPGGQNRCYNFVRLVRETK
jgi:PKD repeat protein